MGGNGKRERLKEFYLQIKDCKKCDLYKTRTNFVFGSGSANAPIVFIGEAPGRNEDLQGRPFVGPAGKLLDELLFSIGFNRNQIFIANILKCRPPGNRDPRIEEINVCKDYLYRQIEIIDPKIICTLGKFSTQLILNTSAGISGLRGRIFRVENRFILPINHPAAALYTPSKMGILREDFQKIRKLLEPGTDFSGEIEDVEIKDKVIYHTGKTTLESVSDMDSDSGSTRKDKGEQLGLF